MHGCDIFVYVNPARPGMLSIVVTRIFIYLFIYLFICTGYFGAKHRKFKNKISRILYIRTVINAQQPTLFIIASTKTCNPRKERLLSALLKTIANSATRWQCVGIAKNPTSGCVEQTHERSSYCRFFRHSIKLKGYWGSRFCRLDFCPSPSVAKILFRRWNIVKLP